MLLACDVISSFFKAEYNSLCSSFIHLSGDIWVTSAS